MLMKAYRADPPYEGYPRNETEGIEFSRDLPKFDGDLAKWALFCEHQALQIERVLWANMPGGVYDRVLAEMCKRKASLLAVPHGTTEEEPKSRTRDSWFNWRCPALFRSHL